MSALKGQKAEGDESLNQTAARLLRDILGRSTASSFLVVSVHFASNASRTLYLENPREINHAWWT
ncbi:hypothetical protein [Nostoc foliaceum]|uniref:Uncharacterized protein n=1 Tax=Nostoc linckia FACHB-391 TaxID=2692906 RepID=A0ABR8ETU0_NOSLI|nr:hypothetical protein [Nostoc foliaceum]MBD2560512.1 hypothetical protein [Nostoc linckia FACHB-391]